MVIERLVFTAKFGQGDSVVAAFKEFRDTLGPAHGMPVARLSVDAAGPMFTLVSETEYVDLSELAQAQERLQALYARREFQDWFARWCDAVASGSRELYHRID